MEGVLTVLSKRIGKSTVFSPLRSFANAVSTSYSTHSLPTECFESTGKSLSYTRMDSSLRGVILSTIFMSSGANQHRTPLLCRSA